MEALRVCSKFPCSALFVMRQIWTDNIELLLQTNLGSSCIPQNLYLPRKQDFWSCSQKGLHSDLNEEQSVTQTRGRQHRKAINRDLTRCIYICNAAAGNAQQQHLVTELEQYHLSQLLRKASGTIPQPQQCQWDDRAWTWNEGAETQIF